MPERIIVEAYYGLRPHFFSKKADQPKEVSCLLNEMSVAFCPDCKRSIAEIKRSSGLSNLGNNVTVIDYRCSCADYIEKMDLLTAEWERFNLKHPRLFACGLKPLVADSGSLGEPVGYFL